jgi:hypothetical protein
MPRREHQPETPLNVRICQELSGQKRVANIFRKNQGQNRKASYTIQVRIRLLDILLSGQAGGGAAIRILS